jgi:hypothetical protein
MTVPQTDKRAFARSLRGIEPWYVGRKFFNALRPDGWVRPKAGAITCATAGIPIFTLQADRCLRVVAATGSAQTSTKVGVGFIVPAEAQRERFAYPVAATLPSSPGGNRATTGAGASAL